MIRHFTIIVLLLLSATAYGEHRVALLIANSDYGEHKLAAPAGNVQKVAKTLTALGYRTTIAADLKRDELKSALERFADTVPTRGTALVYFAGYALQGEKDGKRDNFLLPVGESFRNSRDVGSKGYGLQQLLELLQQRSGSSSSIVLVNGCYGWPEELEGVPDGLIAIEEIGQQALLCYGAKPGKTYNPSDDESSLANDLPSLLRNINASDDSKNYFIANTLEHVDCFDPNSASSAISPADELTEGKQAGDEWVNAQGIVFCWCPPGKFIMGSPETESNRFDDENRVEVQLTTGFWMAKYETTKRECSRRPSRSIATHKNHPIDYVHYDDFQQYVRTLNSDERKAKRLPEDWEYALPSEAQWEYACRAGTNTAYSFGDELQKLAEHGNFADRTLFDARDDYHRYASRQWNDGVAYLSVVGSYRPNAWGLHDMHGNLWELCGTKHGGPHLGGVDPAGPKDGGWATRGGSWASLPDYCRSAFRHRYSSRDEQHWLGFRILLRKK